MTHAQRATQLADVLDGLESPTLVEVFDAVREFNAADVAAVAAYMAKSAGGESPGGSRSEREQVQGAVVSVANGDSANLTWDTKAVGSDLLDLTDPANPAIIAAGVYAVAVEVLATLTVGGTYIANLTLDAAGESSNVSESSPASLAANPQPIVCLSQTYYIPAGGTIVCSVASLDGASTQDFLLATASIQRLS